MRTAFRHLAFHGVLCFVVLLGVSDDLGAANFKKDLEETQTLLKKNREELRLAIDRRHQLKQGIEDSKTFKESSETDFRLSMQRRLGVLLHWPTLKLSLEKDFWIMKDHDQFVLSQVRQRLIEDSLRAIENSKSTIDELTKETSLLETEIKRLQYQNANLSLQLEELSSFKGKR